MLRPDLLRPSYRHSVLSLVCMSSPCVAGMSAQPAVHTRQQATTVAVLWFVPCDSVAAAAATFHG